jgi:hypothetical protein
MRTTLAIDDDVLAYVRAHAQRGRISIGEALSHLARQGIQASRLPPPTLRPKSRFALLPAREEVITSEHVRRLMGQEGI